ncbi:class I SAM-dependent methyltransferase [Corynebacterium bovis]|uniref:class I SAM-dependent methyltransferase n=3 Tax=Corynebacterium bovis TaxID=36808 RepID=UPI0021AB1899|nr:class I SAM-dependent methyltransferase [Corynebacterium bovis]
MPDHAPTGPVPDPTAPALADLVTALRDRGYSAATVSRVLGPDGLRATAAGNPGAAEWCLDRRARAADGDSPRDAGDRLLVRTFHLRRPVARTALAAVLGGPLTDALVACGALVVDGPGADGPDAGTVTPVIDVRPVSVPGHGVDGDLLVVSDADASLSPGVPGPSHVPGVGRAPLTLLSHVPPRRVRDQLDLGCGSGVLGLALDADRTVCTDIHARALAFGRASHRSRPDAVVEWREGSWFDPVAGERFDRIVCNPPFVIGPPAAGGTDGDAGGTASGAADRLIYRDSGLALDGASELVVRHAAEHLRPGGTAHVLAAWATGPSQSPAARVAGWVPDDGVSAWVVERESVTPVTYVDTWVRDASVDPRTAEGRERTRRWLDALADAGVDRIGMGVVHLRAVDGPSEVVVEQVTRPDVTAMGEEVDGYFRRAAWLRGQTPESILRATYHVAADVVRDRVDVPGGDRAGAGSPDGDGDGAGGAGAGSGSGLAVSPSAPLTRVTRTTGARFSHEIDEVLSGILDALGADAADTVPVGLVAELYCGFHGHDEEAVRDALPGVVVDLGRHGILVPTDLGGDAGTTTSGDAAGGPGTGTTTTTGPGVGTSGTAATGRGTL